MGKGIFAIGFLALLAALAYVGLTAAFRFDAIGFGQVYQVLTPLTFVLLGTGALGLLAGIVGFITKNAGSGLFTIVGAIAALGASYGPLSMKMQADKVPAIHDISTDVKYPPEFYAVREIRLKEEAPNTTDYDPAVAKKQLEAYPDLKTMIVDKPYEDVFDAALATVKEMGLEVVATEENAGRIEATATTPWWGFKDDMVIRVNRFTSPVQVDVRSNSRVGMSDLGANAARIESFMTKLEKKLAE